MYEGGIRFIWLKIG